MHTRPRTHPGAFSSARARAERAKTRGSPFWGRGSDRLRRQLRWGAAQVGDEDEIRLLAAYLEADVNASDARTFNFTVTSLLPSLPESE